jgi:cell division GTPase FtsZ
MQVADATLVIPNDMILAEAPNIPINRAFRVMNSVLASPVSLLLKSVGKDDIGQVRALLSAGKVLAMDSAEWDRENAEFAVAELLGKSRWLDLKSRQAKSAILFVEGRGLYDDLMELGKSFSRVTGNGCPLIVASAGERKSGLRVTAVVGF